MLGTNAKLLMLNNDKRDKKSDFGRASQSQCEHDGSTDHGDDLAGETGGGQRGCAGLKTG
jgi:hypothetical protein